MPAIPALIMAGGAIASAKMASNAQKAAARQAQQRSPQETALMGAQTDLANQQRQQGGQLFNSAMPAINNTLSYYQTLLGGNRSARMAAVSPEAQDTAAAYAGADKQARRTLTGGERNTALAENSRAKSGQIARLVTGVRPGAAGAMSGMGANLISGSGGFSSNAAQGYSGLIGNETQNRQQGNLIGVQTGKNTGDQLGSLLAQLMKTYGGGKGGGTSSGGGAGFTGTTGTDF